MRKEIFRSAISRMFVIGILLFLSACSDDESTTVTTPVSTERGAVISYELTGSLTMSQIASNASNVGDVSSYVNNDINLYKVIYNSMYNGSLTQVSGLVMIPQNPSSPFRLIQHHHGTIIPGPGSEVGVPSNYTTGYTESNVEASFIGAVMASNGYVVSLPDYAGYGISSNVEHPYTVHHELAEVSVDMIRATKNLLNTLSISFSNEAFLTGWSEGGGAGLATHKYLQQNYSGEVNLKGSSLFAGPYDYITFFKDIMVNRNSNLDELTIYSWAAYSMNRFNANLNRETNMIWNYTVANQMNALSVPSTKPVDIFQTTFMDGVENETDAGWVAAITENTLLANWVPQGNLFFHSGTLDFVVPHYNSTNAHTQFQSVGASSTLYEYFGGDHYTPLLEYVKTTLNDFNTL